VEQDLRGGGGISTILITGAAGSLGRELTGTLSDKHTVRALDNHESGLAALKGDNVRLMLGDINDRERLDFAMKGCDACIHTAAYKNLDLSEYNIESTFETNIFGTMNVAKACMAAGVKKAILISSDKAVEPISTYGVSKNAQERIWLWAARVFKGCDFVTCRFGNFIGSSGSCFEVWDRQIAAGEKITVTSVVAERYFIEIADVARFIIKIMEIGENGRIYIPKMKEKNIYKLALEHTGCKPEEIVITGLREGEKMRESLYSEHERKRLIGRGDHYVI